MSPMIMFNQVNKWYGAYQALTDLSAEINTGEVVVVCGPSGSGKSTLIRTVNRLEPIDNGQIVFDGTDIHGSSTRLNQLRTRIGFVFQSFNLFPHVSVAENIMMSPMKVLGMKRSEARHQAGELLERVGLSHKADAYPAQLSGGQQQRIAVARALVLEPQVLLLDEPLSNLDERLRRRVRTDIRELQQRLGFTAVYVTHDQEEALAVSDKIIVMKEGDIAQQGAPESLYHSPNSVFIADFMGEANILPCEVEQVEGNDALVRLGNQRYRVRGNGLPTGSAQLSVRPQFITLRSDGVGALQGEVTHSTWLGDHIEYEVATALGSLFIVDAQMEQHLPLASAVTIDFKPQGLALIAG